MKAAVRARRTPWTLVAAVALLSLTLAACGSSGNSTSTSSVSPGSKGTVTVASGNFSESVLIANMYTLALQNAGYTVNTKYNLGNRELYLKAMQNGEIDIIPEYLATLTTFLNNQQHPGKKSPASSDTQATFNALQPLVATDNLVVYTPSPAQDTNAFAVTQATAGQYHLTTLSDVAKNAQNQFVLGGPPECPTRPYCEPGLEQTYGINFKGFKSLDVGTVTINAITGGQVQMGLVLSTSGVVQAKKLVVLADDKHLQNADNVLPLLRKEAASPDAQAVLDQVDQALTTQELQQLNA
ncbi:MAG: ABC transporter substrate-binding protein, partial [Solirubrobacteraceae bacterium]